MNQFIKICFVVLLVIQFVILIELQEKDSDICLKLIAGVSFSKAPNDDIATDYFDCGTKLCASYDKDYIFKICDAAHHEICDSGNYSQYIQELTNQTCISGCSCSENHCFDISLRRCVSTLDRHSTDTPNTQPSGSLIFPESPSSFSWLLQPPYSSLESRQLNRLSHAVGTNSFSQSLSSWRQSLPVTLYKQSPIAWQQTSPLSPNVLAKRLVEKSRYEQVPSVWYEDPSLSLWQSHDNPITWQSMPNKDLQLKRNKWSPPNTWNKFPLQKIIESRQPNLILYPNLKTQPSVSPFQQTKPSFSSLKRQSVNIPLRQNHWPQFQYPGGYMWPFFPGFPDINSLFQGSGNSGSSGGSGVKWTIITNQPIDSDKKYPHFPNFPNTNPLFPGSEGSGWVQISPQGGDDGESFAEFPKPSSDQFPFPKPSSDQFPFPKPSSDQFPYPNPSSDEFPPIPPDWETKSDESGVQTDPPAPPAPSAAWPSGSPDSASNEVSEKLFSGIPEKLINFDYPVPYVDLTEFLANNK